MDHNNEMDGDTLLAWSTPIATLGLLAVTIAYSYFTYQLAETGKRQRHEAIRPRLQIAVVATQRGQFFVLRIENVGLSPALNFKVKLDREVCRTYGGNSPINNAPLLREGVPAFMPNTPVEIGLGVSHTYLGPEVDRKKHPARFNVTATYDFEGRHLQELFPLEVHDLYAETMITHTEMGDLIRAIKEDLAKPIKEAVRSLKSR
jgi:hypothetical protein